MLKDFKAPNLNAPRFRPKVPGVVNHDFIKLLRKEFPELDLSAEQVKDIIAAANDILVENVISQRDGVEFPEQLGCLFMGSVPETKKGNVDYKKSLQYGKIIRHKNYETDGLTMKIFYTNFGSPYSFRFRQLWAFKAVKQFRLKASAAYKQNHTFYQRVENYRKISKIFRARIAGQ
jgi:hypothetical protein